MFVTVVAVAVAVIVAGIVIRWEVMVATVCEGRRESCESPRCVPLEKAFLDHGHGKRERHVVP